MKKRISLRAALSSAGTTLRTAQYDGREHVIVPVVALVEGVIFASNAQAPELVLAEEFAKVPDSWNGRPVCWDHPSLNGQQVSANSPMVLERMAFGQVFNAKVEGDKLALEAWIDLTKVDKIPEARACYERIKKGETVEVSVGAFVDTEKRSGMKHGKKYSGIWRNIVPDHLALLPEGTIGACSIEMGCGTPRAAEGRSNVKKTFKDLLAAFQSRHAAEEYDEEKEDKEEGQSDSETRNMLHDALFAAEPAFLGVVDVFPDTQSVVYATAPEGDMQYFRRGYEISEGKVTLANDPEEVRMTTSYEPVTASADCGCGGGKTKIAPTTLKEDDMKKTDRLKAVIASGKTPFKETDIAALEHLSEDAITALEANVKALSETPATPPVPPTPPAAEPKELTQEEMLARMPEVANIVSEHKAAAAAKKAASIAVITASAHKDLFTKEQLEAKSVDELEKLAKMATAAAKPDNSGRALPKTETDTGVPKPPSTAEAIKAARAKSA